MVRILLSFFVVWSFVAVSIVTIRHMQRKELWSLTKTICNSTLYAMIASGLIWLFVTLF